MVTNPATLACNDVRIPSRTYGIRNGIRFHLNHTEEQFEIIDDSDEHFPFVQVPSIIAPAVWNVKESIGWKYVDDELWGYVGGNPFAKIATDSFRLYNQSGVKVIHIDLTNGMIYTKAAVRSDGIDMPAD